MKSHTQIAVFFYKRIQLFLSITSTLFITYTSHLLAQENAFNYAIANIQSIGTSQQNIGINPAFIPKISTISLHAHHLFSLPQLQRLGITYIKNFDNQSFKTNFQQLGFGTYTQQDFFFAYGRKLNTNLNLGIGFNVELIDVFPYQRQLYPKINLCTQWQLGTAMHIGALIQYDIKTQHQRLNSNSFRLGVSYIVTDEFEVLFEIERTITTSPLVIHSAVNWQLLTKLAVQMGIQLKNFAQWHLGLNYIINDRFNTQWAFSSHQTLGISQQLSIVYQFKKQ